MSICIITCGKSACCPASARSPSAARSGLALIAYEFALLLDLRDVYWAKQGRITIDVGVGGIALTGSYLAALPVLRGLQREKRRAPEPVPAAGTPPAPQPAPEPEAG